MDLRVQKCQLINSLSLGQRLLIMPQLKVHIHKGLSLCTFMKEIGDQKITASCILTAEEIIFVYPEPSNIILSLFLQSTYRKTKVVKKKRKENKTKKYTEISCLNNIQKISCNIILSPNLY